MLKEFPEEESLIVEGYFNRYVGKRGDGYKDDHAEGYGERNEEGSRVLKWHKVCSCSV